MDPAYKPLQQQADRLEHHLIDWTTDHNDPACVQLMRTARDVTEDLERAKAPRTVESRILQVIETIRSQQSFMNPDHALALAGDYEDLRRQVRQLPHY